MKKLLIITVTLLLSLTACHHQRPQVFGVHIDGTLEQFLNDSHKAEWGTSVHFDSITQISHNDVYIKAYTTEVVDVDNEIIEKHDIDILIKLNGQKIENFSYTMTMSEDHFRAVQQSFEHIYGTTRYHDISQYNHGCCWMIGKDCLWLIYDIDSQVAKWEYIIN